jgi:MFS family permease
VNDTCDRRSWLTRNLKVVSVVSFLQDTASELLYPILPIFLTVTLGAPAAVVGAVEGIAGGVAAVTTMAAGRLSDRFRRRPLIAVGYALAALGKVFVAVAWAWPVVLAGRCVDRLGKGVRGAPRDALIATDVLPEDRGKAFGFHRTMDTAGAVVGPLLGLAAYHLADHRLRPLLVIAVLPAVLSALLVLAIREPGPTRPGPALSGAAGGRDGRPAPLPAGYWRVILLLGLFGLINFPDALVILRLHEIGFGVTEIVLAYVGYNLVYTALSYPAGALADRFSPAVVFGTGMAVFAVAYAGLGLTDDRLMVWMLIAGYGAFTALTDGVGKAWISGLLPAEVQGSGQGLFQGITGLAVLVAGIWAGLAWGTDGSAPLVISGSLAAVMSIGVLTGAALHRGVR